MLNKTSIIFQSVRFYKRPFLFQILTIILLTALITGSLLIGSSVKESLKRTSAEKLGNTGFLISSGTRYFNSGITNRLKDSSRVECSGILEMNGYCQSLGSGKTAFSIHIFGVNHDFFRFHGRDTINLKQGEIAVNRKLADQLGIMPGDELIIRLPEVSDIPPDAPFSPEGKSENSIVMKVSGIVEPAECGNFSLSVNQVTPLNIFLNRENIENAEHKINRLLIKKTAGSNTTTVTRIFRHNLKPSDVGLKIRMIKQTNQAELYSDRIFFDDILINEISELIPSSSPVLTYLGNRFNANKKSTPYSFISALPESLYPEILIKDGMIINRWMANDLSAKVGDSVKLYWYSPDQSNKLIERSKSFIVSKIADIKGIWADSILMPEFPGISGKESCTDWDAGVTIKMDEIRKKDEDYWNKYKGTPKAFINYEKGKELWGNNFGSATSIRFPSGVSVSEIENKLSGAFDPMKTGFSISDISGDYVKAADQGVDFGTLFLSLGFFVILASLILLSLAMSSYFNIRRPHINTFYALGFTNRWITQLLITETALISIIGCILGSIAGYLIDIALIRALNTVWTGAVQTNTLNPYFDLNSVISGFIIAFVTIFLLIILKIRRYLKNLHLKERGINSASGKWNYFFLILSFLITFSLIVLANVNADKKLLFSFASGASLLLSLVFLWRQYFLFRRNRRSKRIKKVSHLSRLYYSFNSSAAITPIIFIATGIFIAFVIGINRMDFSTKKNLPSGGTGGYLLWLESAIPVKDNLNIESSKRSLGLDDTIFRDMSFIQMKRSPGNDASCLNLNHITAPPLLGVNPSGFLDKKSFSFASVIGSDKKINPWEYLNKQAKNNIIYGIADQTVLEWGLKLKPGDTLILRTENGIPLKIVMAAGLKSSVFQGNVLIGSENFSKFFPSISGISVMLVDGKPDHAEIYKNGLGERLENFGVNIEKTEDRLASFNRVSNTYLSVFAVFGAFGVIIGVIGLGFVLLKNYNLRKKEFALMLALGFRPGQIKRMIFGEQLIILLAGVSSGIISALIATSPSIKNSTGIPWFFMGLMIIAVFVTGLLTLTFSVSSVTRNSLIPGLRRE